MFILKVGKENQLSYIYKPKQLREKQIREQFYAKATSWSLISGTTFFLGFNGESSVFQFHQDLAENKKWGQLEREWESDWGKNNLKTKQCGFWVSCKKQEFEIRFFWKGLVVILSRKELELW